MSTSAARCPDCNEPTPTGGWVDASGRTHHVGCGDPLGQKAAAARIADLEAALKDAYPFVCIAVDRYRQEHGLTALHETHAKIADNIARLIGETRMPSEVLKCAS